MKYPAFVLAATFGGLIAAQPVMAADAKTQIRVEYADLDLSTPEGQAELDHRVNAAAKEVCGLDDQLTGTRIPSREARKCYKNARQQLSNRIAALKKKEAAGG